MMKPIGMHLIGRFGNQMFQYAYARAWAEREGRELRTNMWMGQRVFEIEDGPLEPGMEMLPQHYRQDQESIDLYSRKQAREWFAWRAEVEEELAEAIQQDRVLSHLRRGDYMACGYPVITKAAVLAAVDRSGVFWRRVAFVCEENPTVVDGFTGTLSFVPDFYRLAHARVLFRANSSFSWWAATLGDGQVYAPVINGLKGGVEHDEVTFVEGNWPKLADLPGITDLRLRDE